MIFDKIIKNLLSEDSVVGGKADKLTPEDIANKHGVSLETIMKQIKMGIKIEREHTTSNAIAKEVAMDHLSEFPDYYTRLAKLEDQAKKDLKEEMVSGEVVGGSGYGGGVAPQDNIDYAKGDARMPMSLFTKKDKKNKKRLKIQRRPRIGM